MNELNIALALLAVVSAVVAFMSYRKADESNKIATRAIDEQLRPQLILYINKRANDEQVLVKNIGNASAMNIRAKVNKPTKNNLSLVADIGEPATLAIGEEKLFVVLPKDQILASLVDRLRYNSSTLLVRESSHNSNQHTITLEYNDISNNKIYTSIFLTLVGGIRHKGTTTKQIGKKY